MDLTFTSMGSASATVFGNGNATSAFAGLSGTYQDILRSGVFGGGSGTSTITLNGLTEGQGYEVQFWVNDARNRADMDTVPRELTILESDGVTLSDVVVDYNTVGASTNAGLGQFVIGTFTADEATQDFIFTSDARQLNALQLRTVAVPELSSIALVGLSGLGLLIRRRRNSMQR